MTTNIKERTAPSLKAEVKNLNFFYGKVQALKNINMPIAEKQVTALIGPSGCGKSTCMHIMGCLDTPTSGKVILGNKDVSKLSDNRLAEVRGRKIGFVFQTFNLIQNLIG